MASPRKARAHSWARSNPSMAERSAYETGTPRQSRRSPALSVDMVMNSPPASQSACAGRARSDMLQIFGAGRRHANHISVGWVFPEGWVGLPGLRILKGKRIPSLLLTASGSKPVRNATGQGGVRWPEQKPRGAWLRRRPLILPQGPRDDPSGRSLGASALTCRLVTRLSRMVPAKKF